MKQTTLMRCCSTQTVLKHFETATNAVLEKLGVEFIDIKEFNCCGYPLKNINFKAFALASARNLALAEKRGLNLLTVCNCCFGSLKEIERLMKDNPTMAEEINATLGREGLRYEGKIQAQHLLQVLHDEIGLDRIRERITRTFDGLKIATHYGCHILRPRRIVQFDNPFAPQKFDRLVELTGARSVPWTAKLDCCGAPLLGVNDALSMDLTQKKVKNALAAGADAFCVSCPYCQVQFDRVQKQIIDQRAPEERLPSILYPQLLGLCLGIEPHVLGLEKNFISLDGITRFLKEKRGDEPLENAVGQ